MIPFISHVTAVKFPLYLEFYSNLSILLFQNFKIVENYAWKFHCLVPFWKGKCFDWSASLVLCLRLV